MLSREGVAVYFLFSGVKYVVSYLLDSVESTKRHTKNKIYWFVRVSNSLGRVFASLPQVTKAFPRATCFYSVLSPALV